MAATNYEGVRLILACLIAPSLPILALAIPPWRSSGNPSWLYLFFLFGYLFFFLIGLPVVGILIKKKTLLRCVIAGGTVALSPLVILNCLTLFVQRNLFTLESLVGYSSIFAAGCAGGALFWLIAFGFKGGLFR